MNQTDINTGELEELCRAAVDGSLDASGAAHLNALVRDDAQAREFYVDYLEVHALLAWRHGAVEPLELPLAQAARPVAQSRWRRPLVTGAAAIALLLAGLALWAITLQAPWQPSAPQPIAVVLGEEDVKWSGDIVRDGNQQLRPGRHRIDEGTAHIELTNGVLLAAAGPCDFDLSAPDHLHLVAGKVHIYSPLATKGFKVTTGRGVQIVDLGTRFGVWVDEEDAVHVHLFEGRLEINNREQLAAGEAMVVDTAGSLERTGVNEGLFPNLHSE